MNIIKGTCFLSKEDSQLKTGYCDNHITKYSFLCFRYIIKDERR